MSITTLIKVVLILVILVLEKTDGSLRECDIESRALNYYKIKSCHRSTLPILFWKRVGSLKDCKSAAREKNGLAFNFSPPEAVTLTKPFLPNCHVLGCPETGDNSTLVMDVVYDYYSAYGNFNSTQNATCVKSVGLFSLTNDYQNYTQSLLACQNASGDLADITSEHRTIMLSNIIKENILDWYKAAYVGLDDMQTEGVFVNGLGKRLTCTNYRAWAPGHPRSKHELEDCVILDSDRLWRVVRCNKVKLRALCELYPQPPNVRDEIAKNVTCDGILNKGKKQACILQKEWFKILQNSSRIDKCAILNFEETKRDTELNDTILDL